MIWITPPDWFRRLWWRGENYFGRLKRRGENRGRKIAGTVYGCVSLTALLFGYDTIGLICLVGMVHELNQIEIARLRAEIRAKKMWHGGEQ